MARPDFSRLWSQNNVPDAITLANYSDGWDFIGSQPPLSGQFDYLQYVTDQKMNWLGDQLPDNGSRLASSGNLMAVGGTADAITLTTQSTGAETSYYAGAVYRFVPSAENTVDNPTVSVDGLAAKTLLVSAGELKAGVEYSIKYDGTDFVGLNVRIETINTASPRNIIQYDSAVSINVYGKTYPMGGFRFFGNYLKDKAPVFSSADTQNNVSFSTDLSFGMSSVVLENWYAVFACANAGDTSVTFKLVPFLRVESVAGSVVTLRKAGEGVHGSAPQTYTWAADALNGVDCLVISETVDGRANAFSGRETTITDSTTTTVTLNSIGSVAVGDFLLPSPDGFDFYRYCGSVYYDTAEVRNIADSGSIVRSRGIYDLAGTASGAITKELRTPAGYISPLATAVIIQGTGTLGTASEGQYVEIYDIDSGSHSVSTFDFYKAGASSQSFATHDIVLSFSFGQQWHYSNAGTLAASVTNIQSNYWGWIES